MGQLNDLTIHGIVAAGVFLLFVLMTRVVRMFLGFLGRKIFEKTETILDDRILAVVLKNVRPAMIVAGLMVALRIVAKGTDPSEKTILLVLEYGNNILYVAGVIVMLNVMIGILREIIQWYLDRISSDGAAGLKMTLGPLATKIVNILIGLVAAIIILDHFGVNIGSLLVSLGVGSLAVALAAQDTLANMIAGFVILIDRPFRVGDRVEIASGVTGDVTAIGLRSTRLLNFDNNVIIVPNSDLTKSRIVNVAFPHVQTRIMIRFDLAYGTDIETVRTILLSSIRTLEGVVQDPAPRVLMTGAGELSIQVTMIAHAADYRQAGAIEVALREQAYTALIRHNVAFPSASHIIRIDGGKTKGVKRR